MNIEVVYQYCLSLPFAEETFPFDEETLVFKVFGKIFAILNLNSGNTINLKCDPDLAEKYRLAYDAIIPGYHMNKKHWNTVYLDRHLNDHFICEMILNSYRLVVKSLPKKYQELCGIN